jgi:hypothetical protein
MESPAAGELSRKMWQFSVTGKDESGVMGEDVFREDEVADRGVWM